MKQLKIPKPKLNKKWLLATIMLFVALAIGTILLIGSLNKGSESNKLFVVVNGTEISESTKQSEINRLTTFYSYSNQGYDTAAIEQTVENNLIEKALLEQYASSNSINVDELEIQDYYDQRAATAGSEEELLEQVNSLYGYDKDAYLTAIKDTILRDRIQKSMDEPLADWLKAQKESANITIY